MIDLLLDTDIGIDCDDAMAIALALSLERQGYVRLVGVSTCTARSGASGAVRAVARACGAQVDTSVCSSALQCDSSNVYAAALRDRFGTKDGGEESVRFLRRKLAAAARPVALAALGPLTVVAGLLKSGADDISPLGGRELAVRSVSCLYAMAGNFVHREKRYGGRYPHTAEWNVCQDIAAARYVADHFPGAVVFCPYEAGADVLSGEGFGADTPVGAAIRLFYESAPDLFPGKYARSSWDPVTVAVAAGLDLFDLSPRGKIVVGEDGTTDFSPGGGEHRYIIERHPPAQTAAALNALYPLSEGAAEALRRA